ncbi:MAG TPA: flagellar hook-associated protein FlgK [Bacillota bacterium]|nr:flagellar hook-associated protein FlgK [Bacillota bacterium]
MSTFHGLEMARQALFAQQSALYTTGHNISNANTDGYSRQRVNFETTSPFPAASRNRPHIPGQMGTGVQIDTVQRLRDRFLDMQYRAENSKAGYWDTKNKALGRLETVLNEPSKSGLSHTMDQFWESLQTLSVNPDNTGARSVVSGRGEAVADTLNYLSKTIQAQRAEQESQIDVTVKKANSLLHQINEINGKINAIEPHGYVANDLYDDRDRLIDELSEIVNIHVTHESSGEAPASADGVVTIKLADSKGTPFDPERVLVNGQAGEYNNISVHKTNEGVSSIEVDGETIEASQFIDTLGSLSALIETYGYEKENSEDFVGVLPDMLEQLDNLAAELAYRFNEVHKDGFALDGSAGIDFFVPNEEGATITAENIRVHQQIIDHPDLIAASETMDFDGDGKNAINLGHVFDRPFADWDKESSAFEENQSIDAFYESIIGNLGVDAQEAKRMYDNTEILRSQVSNQRLSVSAVSLDEEMSNMIQFQHAYNAAARSMTTIDEMLDKIINGMGIVGR